MSAWEPTKPKIRCPCHLACLAQTLMAKHSAPISSLLAWKPSPLLMLKVTLKSELRKGSRITLPTALESALRLGILQSARIKDADVQRDAEAAERTSCGEHRAMVPP